MLILKIVNVTFCTQRVTNFPLREPSRGSNRKNMHNIMLPSRDYSFYIFAFNFKPSIKISLNF